MCSHSSFCFSFSWQHATWKQGLLRRGGCWMDQSWIMAGSAEWGYYLGERVWRSSLGLSGWGCWLVGCFRWRLRGWIVLWPLDVPAEVGHLHVAPHHEGAGQVEAVLRVGSDQLVLFTEGITEHLIQSRGHSKRQKVKENYLDYISRYYTQSVNLYVLVALNDVSIYWLVVMRRVRFVITRTTVLNKNVPVNKSKPQTSLWTIEAQLSWWGLSWGQRHTAYCWLQSLKGLQGFSFLM